MRRLQQLFVAVAAAALNATASAAAAALLLAEALPAVLCAAVDEAILLFDSPQPMVKWALPRTSDLRGHLLES